MFLLRRVLTAVEKVMSSMSDWATFSVFDLHEATNGKRQVYGNRENIEREKERER